MTLGQEHGKSTLLWFLGDRLYREITRPSSLHPDIPPALPITLSLGLGDRDRGPPDTTTRPPMSDPQTRFLYSMTLVCNSSGYFLENNPL